MTYRFQVPLYSGVVMRDRFIEAAFEGLEFPPNHQKQAIFRVVPIEQE